MRGPMLEDKQVGTGTQVRAFYERLIDEGVLRVVGKVEILRPNTYDCQLTCSGCGDGAPYYLLEEFEEVNYCPNCGAKVDKPAIP